MDISQRQALEHRAKRDLLWEVLRVASQQYPRALDTKLGPREANYEDVVGNVAPTLQTGAQDVAGVPFLGRNGWFGRIYNELLQQRHSKGQDLDLLKPVERKEVSSSLQVMRKHIRRKFEDATLEPGDFEKAKLLRKSLFSGFDDESMNARLDRAITTSPAMNEEELNKWLKDDKMRILEEYMRQAFAAANEVGRDWTDVICMLVCGAFLVYIDCDDDGPHIQLAHALGIPRVWHGLVNGWKRDPPHGMVLTMLVDAAEKLTKKLEQEVEAKKRIAAMELDEELDDKEEGRQESDEEEDKGAQEGGADEAALGGWEHIDMPCPPIAQAKKRKL